jgi:hypothetical protein
MLHASTSFAYKIWVSYLSIQALCVSNLYLLLTMGIRYPLNFCYDKRLTFEQCENFNPTSKDFRKFRVRLPQNLTPYILKDIRSAKSKFIDKLVTEWELDEGDAILAANLYNKDEENSTYTIN